MTKEQREQVRLSLLRYCGSAAEYGLATGLLSQFLQNEGLRVGAHEVRAELLYLADKGLVVSLAKVVSPENEAWRITAAGRDLLAMKEEQ